MMWNGTIPIKYMDFINNINNKTIIYVLIDSEELSSAFSTAMAIVFITIIVSSIVANITLILTIATSRKLYSIQHVFIVSLAIADLLTACLVIPYDANYMLKGYYSYDVIECGLMHTAFLMSLPLEILNLTLLTIERFITIAFPFRRDTLLTKRNIVLALLIIWFYTPLASLFPLMYDPDSLTTPFGNCQYTFSNNFSIFHGSVNFLLPILIMTVLNVIIFQIANQHKKQIEMTYKDCKQNIKRKKGKLANFRRGAKRVVLLFCVVIMCWLPYIVLVIWNVACDICHPREVTWIGNAVNYMSGALNPILYGLCNGRIRKEALKKLTKMLIPRKYSFRKANKSPANSKQTGHLVVSCPVKDGFSDCSL